MNQNTPTHRLDPAHFGDIMAGFVPLDAETAEAVTFDRLARQQVDRYRCTSWGRVTAEQDVVLVEDVTGGFALLWRERSSEQVIIAADTPLALDARALDENPNAVAGIIVPVAGAVSALPYEMRGRALPAVMFTEAAAKACAENGHPPFRPTEYLAARDLGTVEEAAFEEARDFFRRLSSWRATDEGRGQQGEQGGESIPQGTALARFLGRK